MDRGLKPIFFQRRHNHDQQVHENVLNIREMQIETMMKYLVVRQITDGHLLEWLL